MKPYSLSYTREKEKLKANKHLFQNLLPTNRSREVALIQENWYHAFIDWLQSDRLPPPGKLQQKLLYKGHSVNPQLKYHDDYEVIEKDGWDLINSFFGPAPKIIRPYVRHPKTKEACVLLNSFHLRIKHEEGIIKKACAMDWKLFDIKVQLCKTLGYSTIDYIFSSSKNLDSIDGLSIEDLSVKKYDFIYLLKKASSQKPSISNSVTSAFLQNHNNPEANIKSKPSNSTNLSVNNNNTENSLQSNNNENNVDINISSPKKSSKKFDISTFNNSIKINPNYSPKRISDLTNINSEKLNNTIQCNPEIPSDSTSTHSRSKSSVDKKNSQQLETIVFPKVVGLKNVGNTCYFNAAVQCLARLPSLTNYVLSPKFDNQINKLNPLGSHGLIGSAYKQFLYDLGHTNEEFINPFSLKQAISSKYRQFANSSQQDSQELLNALLDGLHEDLNQSGAARGSRPVKEINDTMDSWTIHRAKNSSPIMNLFHGNYFSSLECPKCKKQKFAREHFSILTIEIPKTFFNKSVKLNDCLSDFSKTKILDSKNLWECPYCKEKVNAIQKFGVYRCGHILIIQLKRFGNNLRKNKTEVDYPDEITDSFCLHNKNITYKLVGVVFHNGDLSHGHYTSAAFDYISNQWIYYNDEKIQKISSSFVHSDSAYILFYSCL